MTEFSRQKTDYRLPGPVLAVLEKLEQHGYEAYVVGGAVRDILLGKEPVDFDITTGATPSEVMEVFGEDHCHPTGIAHGTVTVVVDGLPLEVTTFRIDGQYKDLRHPEQVFFTRNLEEDVKRRDFTINALAMSRGGEIVDFCGGIEDLHAGVIRAVGEPGRRFEEDALRILRALRFAAQTGFDIEKMTAEEALRQKASLSELSAERIWQELRKLFCGARATSVLREYFEIFAVILPEIVPMKGCQQHNPHHIYDVWEHSLVAMENVPSDVILRTTMLFHDIGKPACFFMDENGTGHFNGHQALGADMADTILRRLKVDTNTRESVVYLIKIHDMTIEPREKIVRRRLAQMGEEMLRRLILVKRADMKGHSQLSAYRFAEIDAFEALLDKTLQDQLCYSFDMLNVDGKDLISIGMAPGPALGKVKKQLLDEVIEDKIPNEKTALLLRAQAIRDEMGQA